MKVGQQVYMPPLANGLDHGFGGMTGLVLEVENDGRALIEVRILGGRGLIYAYDESVEPIDPPPIDPKHPSATVRMAARLKVPRAH